ncbi:MAG: hypothetical protein F6K10_42520 [Moorea sp. SIO2B7]|nr:hypothetical protein [Moorena sp. SIO2B7]
MKYFFLSEGWTFERVWEFGGLWNQRVWRRPPEIQRLNLGIVEQSQTLWLYQVEDAVIMIEVKPTPEVADSVPTIGQVLLKRLITAEQAIERLTTAEVLFSNLR